MYWGQWVSAIHKVIIRQQLQCFTNPYGQGFSLPLCLHRRRVRPTHPTPRLYRAVAGSQILPGSKKTAAGRRQALGCSC
jgi:hypothetical protein